MNDRLHYRTPAGEDWNRALPIGNGRLGAMVFGNLVAERLQLNEDSVWNGGPRDRVNPDARTQLPVLRNLLLEGRLGEAHALVNDALAGMPDSMRCYEPLADVLFEFQHPGIAVDQSGNFATAGHTSDLGVTGGQVANYRRDLDLSRGVASVSYELGGIRYTREHLASFPDQGVACRFTTDTPGSLSFRLRMIRGPLDSYSSRYADGVRQVDGNGLFTWGRTGGEDGIRFAVSLRAEQEGGELVLMGDTLMVRHADAVTLVVSAATSFREEDPHAVALATSTRALERGWPDLLARHEADYRDLFNRVSLDLPGDAAGAADLPTDERLGRFAGGEPDPGLAALYFQFGRYLMIAGSRPGSLPLNLQGIWNQDFQPAWGSKFTCNINTEMNYWPAGPANLADCVEPLFDLVERLVEPGRHTARTMYGCRGFVAHHNTDIWADTAPTDRNLACSYWPMGGAWFSLAVWDCLDFVRNLGHLERIFPILRDACLFYLDFLIEDAKGRLVICPSVSPENTYRLPNGEVGTMSVGCSMDSQILDKLFRATAEACQALDQEPDLARQVEEARLRLPQPQVNPEGRLQEWPEDYEELEPRHRHVSHLFALHPGDQIAPGTTPDLAEAARRTLERRGDSGTGWSIAWKINFWARLLDGDHALLLIRNLLSVVDSAADVTSEQGGSYPNLFCAHPPFQIDGNFGGCAAIAELLLQSHERLDGLPLIRVLPALPSEWRDGRVSGLCARGGFVLSFAWEDHALTSLVISSARGGACRVGFDGRTESVDLAPAGTVTLL